MKKSTALREKKVTVMLPESLIEKALQASGEGLTPTLRMGLELVAARNASRELLKFKGKFSLGIDSKQIKNDRE